MLIIISFIHRQPSSIPLFFHHWCWFVCQFISFVPKVHFFSSDIYFDDSIPSIFLATQSIVELIYFFQQEVLSQWGTYHLHWSPVVKRQNQRCHCFTNNEVPFVLLDGWLSWKLLAHLSIVIVQYVLVEA